MGAETAIGLLLIIAIGGLWLALDGTDADDEFDDPENWGEQ